MSEHGEGIFFVALLCHFLFQPGSPPVKRGERQTVKKEMTGMMMMMMM